MRLGRGYRWPWRFPWRRGERAHVLREWVYWHRLSSEVPFVRRFAPRYGPLLLDGFTDEYLFDPYPSGVGDDFTGDSGIEGFNPKHILRPNLTPAPLLHLRPPRYNRTTRRAEVDIALKDLLHGIPASRVVPRNQRIPDAGLIRGWY